ncbi:hypothetical protein [Polyangium fumosum]|uniref:hypothetical protein n=1 Tax=Polyangium fumosum TaxID=889272 RepID=UPI001B85E437|nr:hypothetical protein [Polyangium fumosum]
MDLPPVLLLSFDPHRARGETLLSLVPRLVSASPFEEAATAVLQAMFACTAATFDGSPHATRARLLRGVVHLRPEGSYQRIFGIDRPTGARIEGTGDLT